MNSRKNLLKILQGILSILPLVACIPAKACTPPDTTCDVIKLTDGKLIYGKVKDIEQKIVRYTGCGSNTGDSMRIILSSSVARVTYANGEHTLVSEQAPYNAGSNRRTRPDSIKKPWLYFAADLGSCLPGGTYGSNSYSLYDNLYAGFATPGYCFDIKAELRSKSGWAGALQCNYYHNPSSMGEIIGENPQIYYEGITHYKTEVYSNGISSTKPDGATYNYNHYSVMIVPAKYFYWDGFSINLHIGFGSLSFHHPSINGTVTMAGYDTISKNQVTRSFPLNIASESQSTALYNIGIGIDVHIFKGIYIKAGYDFSLANINITGAVVIKDASGSVLGTGNTAVPITLVFNDFSAGVEYGF